MTVAGGSCASPATKRAFVNGRYLDLCTACADIAARWAQRLDRGRTSAAAQPGRRQVTMAQPGVAVRQPDSGRAAGADRLRFCLLGPVEVLVDGRPVSIGGTAMRSVLALLLLHPNQIVSRNHILDALWGHEPPESPLAMIHTYIHRVRRLLTALPG